MIVFGSEVELERFSNSRAFASSVRGGFYFQPTTKTCRRGPKLTKKPLSGCAFVA
jgi:hypothetical protein